MPRRNLCRNAEQSINRAITESLEPRRLLAVVSGTAAADVITMFVDASNRTVVQVNGSTVVTNTDATFVLNGLGSDDTFQIDEIRANTSVTVRGGAGNDTVLAGSGNYTRDLNGSLHVEELQSEGNNDLLAIQDYANGTGTHGSLRVEDDRVFPDFTFPGDRSVYYDGFVERKVINFSAQNDTVFVDSSAFGMVLDLSDGNDTVTYGGPAHIIPTLNPQTINGGLGTDTIIFDDTGRPLDDVLFVGGANVMQSQVLQSVENLELWCDTDQAGDTNTLEFAGGFPVSQNINVIGMDTLLDETRIGAAAAPIDLDSASVSFFSDSNGSFTFYDQQSDASNQPFELFTSANAQHLRKGGFEATMTMPIPAPFQDIEIRSGSANDQFAIGGLRRFANAYLNLTIFAGGGDDSIYTTNANGFANDLDAIFDATANYYFDGQAGIDSITLNDSGDAIDDGDSTYTDRHINGLGEHISKHDSFNVKTLDLQFASVDRLSLTTGGSNDTIYFSGTQTSQVTLNGGGGDDSFFNLDDNETSFALDSAGTAVIVGGLGDDQIGLVDHEAAGVDEYAVAATYVASRDGNNTRYVNFDATLEHLTLEQNDASTSTFVHGKPAAMTLSLLLGGGNDQVTVGNGDFDDHGLFVSNTTVLGGAGNDTITATDFADEYDPFENENFTFELFSLSKGTAGVTYGGFESQQYTGSSSADGLPTHLSRVFINAIQSSIGSTLIFANGSRMHTVNVADGNFANLTGSLNIELHGSGPDTINFNNQNGTGDKTYELTATQLLQPYPISFIGANLLAVNAGTGNDLLVTSIVNAGTAVTLNGGTGNDLISVGNGAFAGLDGSVTAIGGGGTSDEVRWVNSFEVTPISATLTATSFSANGVPNLYYADCDLAKIIYGGTSTTAVNSTSIPTTITGTNGNDVVNVGNGDIDANIPTVGTLFVDGKGGFDRINLNDQSDTADADQYIFDITAGTRFRKIAGPITSTVTSLDVEERVLNANNGHNLISVSTGVTAVRINANGGNDDIQIDDATATAPATVSSGSGDDQLSVNGDNDADTARAIIAQDDSLVGLRILQGGRVMVQSGATLAKESNGITDIRGTIDLNGGAFLSRADGLTSAAIRTLIQRGYNAGAWNGTNGQGAINSTLANASSLPDAIGYGLGSEILPTTSGSFSIAPGDTLVRYTYYGDADLNGVVNFDDYARMDLGFSTNRTGWVNGDFNYNGVNNFDDYALIDLAFNTQGPPLGIKSLPRQVPLL